MKTKSIGKLIFFGLAGHCIELAPRKVGTLQYGQGTLSGYEDPESFQNRLDKGDYADYELEGAIVIDKRAALETDYTLSFKSPMCSLSVKDDQDIDRCPTPSPIMAAAMAGNEFGTYLAMQATGYGKAKPADPGPLDGISPKAYADWWEAHGAKIGVFSNNRIVWNDSEHKHFCHYCGTELVCDWIKTQLKGEACNETDWYICENCTKSQNG